MINKNKDEEINDNVPIYMNIGKYFDSQEIQTLLKSNPNYKIKEIKNYIYVSFYDHGFSLCFNNKILDSVYLYNDNIQGFKRYNEDMPYKIKWNMYNKNIVEKFGDTNHKGGGNVPIWLCYSRLGIEFTFLGKMWDDLENPLIYINIFPKQVEENKECSVCLKEINELFKCDNNCGLVQYCSINCRNSHINYHLKYCS